MSIEECRLRVDKTNVPHGRKIRVTYVDEAGYVQERCGPIMHNAFWPRESPADSVCLNVGQNGLVSIVLIPFADIFNLDTGRVEADDAPSREWMDNIFMPFALPPIAD
jgi:hypothetical protein